MVETRRRDSKPVETAPFVFRSRKADRLKLIYWDGSGLVMAHKRVEEHSFLIAFRTSVTLRRLYLGRLP
ncbi:transposase [Agrobacterium rhizogenes]|uniref:IS66 family insertion sequence element accessory protein TnpB n=1 Tax=Rhizobium rhizogenes TaxID=359 RepID=UPI0015729503|nr:transposase [Rhizobium rhizogenes]